MIKYFDVVRTLSNLWLRHRHRWSPLYHKNLNLYFYCFFKFFCLFTKYDISYCDIFICKEGSTLTLPAFCKYFVVCCVRIFFHSNRSNLLKFQQCDIILADLVKSGSANYNCHKKQGLILLITFWFLQEFELWKDFFYYLVMFL